MITRETSSTQKLAIAGVLTAVAVAGSLISVPVAGSKCAPVQHMVNVFAAVMLGPWWGIGIAFCASFIRNLLGIGSLLAFPGSMIGALCCGLVFHFTHKLSLTCVAEALGTGILGGLAAYGNCTCRIYRIYDSIFYFYLCRQCAGLCRASHL